MEMTFGQKFTNLHSSPKERQLQISCISFGEECNSLLYDLLLKGIMYFSSNPLAGKPVLPKIPPENLRSIGPGITENWPKCVFLSAHVLVSVTGGPFDVYDVTSDTYLVFPPLIAKFCYRLSENLILSLISEAVTLQWVVRLTQIFRG